jgi:hypothetical protein
MIFTSSVIIDATYIIFHKLYKIKLQKEIMQYWIRTELFEIC